MQIRRALPATVRVGTLAAAALVIVCAGGLGVEAKAGSNPTVANNARVAGDRERTRFIADLSKKVNVHVFALGNPYRVIVDAPDVNFQMPDGLGKEKRGLVTAYRYGLFAPGKSRIVTAGSGPSLLATATKKNSKQSKGKTSPPSPQGKDPPSFPKPRHARRMQSPWSCWILA